FLSAPRFQANFRHRGEPKDLCRSPFHLHRSLPGVRNLVSETATLCKPEIADEKGQKCSIEPACMGSRPIPQMDPKPNWSPRKASDLTRHSTHFPVPLRNEWH